MRRQVDLRYARVKSTCSFPASLPEKGSKKGVQKKVGLCKLSGFSYLCIRN
jgi:hypothetical protein